MTARTPDNFIVRLEWLEIAAAMTPLPFQYENSPRHKNFLINNLPIFPGCADVLYYVLYNVHYLSAFMPVPAHLLAKADGVDLNSLLSDWRWLLPENLKPTVTTAFGDLFLCDEEVKVHFLDTLYGELKCVAGSKAEFEQLCEDRDFRRKYFQSFFVMEMRKMHGDLEVGECYSCDIRPTLGAQLDPEEFERTDLEVHLSILGQVHSQTKRLPTGTKIDKINIVPPHEDP